MHWRVEQRGGLYLPEADLWLDPPHAVAEAFVSHAHSDHIARHQKIICTEATGRLLQLRLGGSREMTILSYGQPFALRPEVEITLYPAGHILGSAQIFLERSGRSLLYTGDFKMRPGRTTEGAATPRADVLIMETTFGCPRYVMPAAADVMPNIVQFCRETLEHNAVPVLFAYALGKSQEVLAGLVGAGFPIMLAESAQKITQVYESCGYTFPPYRALEPAQARGHVVLAPPQSQKSVWWEQLPPRRTAMITGWALESRARYRYRTDAAFPLSDHADFNELLALVERVQPREIYTVHGFACEFAQTLRERGYEAWALGRENQLEFRLGIDEEDGVE